MKKHAPVTRREPSPSTFTAAPIAIAQAKVRDVEKRIRRNEEKAVANKSEREGRAGVREAKKAEIAALKSQTPEDITATTAHERRRLVAKIALGDAAESDLAKFDQDAAEKQRAFAASTGPREAIQALEDIVEELDEKIGKLDADAKTLVAERDALVAEGDAAWCRFIRECAEADGAEYRLHAEKAFAALLRVVNLGAFLHRLEGHPNGIGVGARDFCAPTVGTSSTALPFEKKTRLGVDTNLYSIASKENYEKYTGPSSEVPLFEEFEKAGLTWPQRMNRTPDAIILRRVPVIAEATTSGMIARPLDLRGPDGCVLPEFARTEPDEE